MSWFSEQILQRAQSDNDTFQDAVYDLAGAVLGKRLAEALDNQAVADSAIEEILHYYKIKEKGAPIPSNVKDINEQLEFRFRPHGIMRRTVQLEPKWYRWAVGAMLGTLKESGHVVALLPGKVSGYSFYNPDTGEQVHLNAKTEKMLDEEALCFYKPLPLRKLTAKDLLAYMVSTYSSSDLVMMVAAALIVTLVGMIIPALNQQLFSTVLDSGSVRLLVSIAIFMVCTYASSRLFTGIRTLINNRINIKQGKSIQSAVMMRIMSLPASFFKGFSAGELTQRAQYVGTLCTTLSNGVMQTGLTSILSLIYLVQIFQYAPALVVPSLCIVVATALFSLISTRVEMKKSKQEMEYASQVSGMSYAMITGIQKIKLSGAEKRAFSRWAKLYSKQAEVSYNPPLIIKLNGVITTAIGLIGILVMYAVSVRSGISVANYYAFNTAYAMVSGAFLSLMDVALTIAKIKPILEMIRPILDAQPELSTGKEVLNSIRGSVELSNVSFRYSDDMPMVIDDLSLKIKAGQYVAIVGTTGCGKSTLMRLMLGFEQPQRGAVYFDGKDISKVDLKSLRRKIGAVMQNGKLFQGDIYSNIVISAPQLTLDDAWEAAEMAGIADDIREMPMGMHTIISEGAGGISGGQRQRLMIARALAPKPKVLMFDEATSALDNLTQKQVSEAIDKLKCTRIVIAHRLSTIRHCDRIIVLDKGKIIEDGTYEELTERGGFFSELVARQRLDVENN